MNRFWIIFIGLVVTFTLFPFSVIAEAAEVPDIAPVSFIKKVNGTQLLLERVPMTPEEEENITSKVDQIGAWALEDSLIVPFNAESYYWHLANYREFGIEPMFTREEVENLYMVAITEDAHDKNAIHFRFFTKIYTRSNGNDFISYVDPTGLQEYLDMRGINELDSIEAFIYGGLYAFYKNGQLDNGNPVYGEWPMAPFVEWFFGRQDVYSDEQIIATYCAIQHLMVTNTLQQLEKYEYTLPFVPAPNE